MSSVAYHYVSSLLVRGRRSHHCVWGKGQGSIHSNQFRRRLTRRFVHYWGSSPDTHLWACILCWPAPCLMWSWSGKSPKCQNMSISTRWECCPFLLVCYDLWAFLAVCFLWSWAWSQHEAPDGRYLPAMAEFPPRFPLGFLSPWSWRLSGVSEVSEECSPVREAEESRYVLSLQLVIL